MLLLVLMLRGCLFQLKCYIRQQALPKYLARNMTQETSQNELTMSQVFGFELSNACLLKSYFPYTGMEFLKFWQSKSEALISSSLLKKFVNVPPLKRRRRVKDLRGSERKQRCIKFKHLGG